MASACSTTPLLSRLSTRSSSVLFASGSANTPMAPARRRSDAFGRGLPGGGAGGGDGRLISFGGRGCDWRAGGRPIAGRGRVGAGGGSGRLGGIVTLHEMVR